MTSRSSTDLLYDVAIKAAARTNDPNERLHHLETASRLKPQDEKLATVIAALRLDLVTGPTYVAIETARVVGRSGVRVEGQVYVLESDGRLRPISGRELVQLEERHRGFARHWRLSGTEWEPPGIDGEAR